MGKTNILTHLKSTFNLDVVDQPQFFEQIAELYSRACDYIDRLSDEDSCLIHSQLIKPNNYPYWMDSNGWALYLPEMSLEHYEDYHKL
ncbi:hypothetical protein MNBD_GAMMA12-3816 [hydrothermal vent metagenome]|uniref:Uncharacterized protein n=1 Tax=hydrothermal vent metagenome TaxID=652676 RepID=A0A3B0XTA0_9ZZZZ